MSANFPDPMEQLKKQQDFIRQQQQMAAWMEQNKGAGQAGAGDPFSRVEAEVARLRAERDAGRLSPAGFEAQLKELMVQDESGAWWMLGADSGTWYRHDGTNWIQADPPRGIPRPVQSYGGRKAKARSSMPGSGHPGRAVIFFILGMVAVLVLGYMTATFIPTILQPSEAWAMSRESWEMTLAGCCWMVGFILVLIIAIRIGKKR